jgi:phage shock protein PspC (stress-responsive transcriptional regulator)
MNPPPLPGLSMALWNALSRWYAVIIMNTMKYRTDRTEGVARRRSFGLARVIVVALAVTSTACAAVPVKRPSEPLVTGEPKWPEEVVREAERADRVCGTREAQLLYDYHEGKEEQQSFKTMMGSITGGVGTVGGVVGGVGAYVIDSPDTVKTMTGITGFVTAGLGAAGSVITILVSPGKAKMDSSSQSLMTIGQKKDAARAALKDKDPSTWSDAEKEAWAKASKELEAACK